MRCHLLPSKVREQRGIALVIVLAFVVLLTGLVVAFFSRTASERQVSNSSANETKSELVAQGALETILADLKQEITAGSTITMPGTAFTIYSPKSTAPKTAVPALVGSSGSGGLENLVKRSVFGTPFYPVANYDGNASNRAAGPSAQTSTTVPSQNQRTVSLARWNKPLLLRRADEAATNDTDVKPVAGFTAPDWVIVPRDGSVQTSWSNNFVSNGSNPVLARYAYTIYDEGGLLDMNAAGYPTASTATQVGRKGSISYSDLRTLPGISSLSVGRQDAFMNNIVGWRNFVSAGANGNLGTFSSSSYTVASGTSFYNAITSGTNTFLTTSNTSLTSGQSDRMFTSRQELLRLLLTGMASSGSGSTSVTERSALQTTLQYLGIFSREQNRATWSPSTPAGSTIDYAAQAETAGAINRNLATVRTTASFTRNDGTTASIGEPLLKTRFSLRRLSWITYAGPSASRTIPPASPALAVTDPNYDMWQLLYTYGVPQSYLQQGTAANVKASFGLVWDSRIYAASPRAGQQWVYDSPSSTNSGGNFTGTTGTVATVIKTLNTVQSEAREPDFFEILKAVTLNGSIGLGSTNAANTFVVADAKYYDTTNGRSADYQIMQIGANIIDSWDTDNFPTFLGFNANEPTGIENLPYLNKLVFTPNFPPQGNGYFDAWLVPSLWNPHQNASNATGSIRIVLSGSGSYTATGVDKAGAVTTTTISPPMAPLPASMDISANGFGTPTPPSDPAPAPSAITPAITNVGVPERFYGFHYPFTSTTPNATLVNQQDADSAYPDFGSGGMNVELQVQVPGTASLISYQTWQIAATSAPLKVQSAKGNFNQGNSNVNLNSNKLQDPEFIALDPRTSRFGVWGTSASGQTGGGNAKKDYYAGASDSLDQQAPANRIEQITFYRPQGAKFTVSAVPPADLSLYSTNGTPNSSNHYVDLDDVQRSGDWTTTAPGTTKGTTIMYASAKTTPPGGNYRDRPNLLSAPFQSVAELGQVFRDQPWKTLNFTTANSADAGLLDAFTLQDVPMVAGRTSLNTRQVAVLTAILSQTTKRLDGTSVLTPTEIYNAGPPPTGIAPALVNLTTANPMISKGELVTTLAAHASVTGLGNKEAREAVMRALSDAGQTRTWNLMIDVIAQSGRYPSTATNLSQFVVEGEKRYWLHVAIDRFTGQVIDRQIEVVNE